MLAPAVALALALAPQGIDHRPTLSGPERIRDTADGLFKIHYTMEGTDALLIAVDEDPANGIPDTVDWAEEGAARMVAVFAGEDGWAMPVPDEGAGGDDRIDIYLVRMQGMANGVAWSETTPSGKVTGHVQLNTQSAGLGKFPYQSVSGHEVFHILEVSLAHSFIDGWIAEASAAWAQYLLFTGEDRFLNLAREALWQARLAQPERALDDEDGTYEYAGMVWVKYLVDRGGGDRKLVLKLWQAMADKRGAVAGHNAFLPTIGVASMVDAAAEYAVWNWFACANDDGHHYDPNTNACRLKLSPSFTTVAAPGGGSGPSVGLLGSAYLVFPPDCKSADLSVSVRPSGRMRFQLVGEVPGGESPVASITVEAGAEGTLPLPAWNQYRRVALVATSLVSTSTFVWTSTVSGDYQRPATPTAPLSITVAPATLLLGVGDDEKLAATADLGCFTRDVTAEVTWTSTDATIAATSSTGVVTGKRMGTADVVATIGKLSSNRVTVTVEPGADGGGCGVGGRASPSTLLLGALLLLVALSRRRI